MAKSVLQRAASRTKVNMGVFTSAAKAHADGWEMAA